ncbi:hypothetical protein INT46_000086 [Mucor plumbeus]|uniref:Uncharacterized protein n=1 Tax=Mucor plumbeus TaxID=97098 RepID=A0A8H7QL23_9FUNG|nr:hypothetical protein INT46_000086 [Mucor plumbeus]
MEEKSPVDQTSECLYRILDNLEDEEQEDQEVEVKDAQNDNVLFSSSSTLFTANTFIPTPSKEQTKSNINIIKATKQVNISIPGSRNANILPTLFSCEATCIHYLTYKLQNEQQNYKQFDLDKLDVVLNSTGVLDIKCIFLLNGLKDSLEYPSWLQLILNAVMRKCGFKPSDKSSPNEENTLYCFEVKKAFVTTPISYVLDKQAPHGTLDTFEVVFNITSSRLKEFQANWKKRLTLEIMSDYLEEALTEVLIKRTCYLYPLIFNSTYAKKLTQSLSYLPQIAQSLQKIYITSRSTMSVTNHAFSESIEQKMDIIKKNVDIMRPYKPNQEATSAATNTPQNRLKAITQNDSISEYLILGMYYSLKTANKPAKTSLSVSTFDPPNALCSIARLWSITCSTSYDDDALI